MKMLTSKLNSSTETVYVTNKVLELLEYLNFFFFNHEGHSKIKQLVMKPAFNLKASLQQTLIKA